MDSVMIGAAMVGSIGTAWVLQKALLGAVLYTIDPRRTGGKTR